MKNQQANQVKITTEIERTRCQQGKLLNEYLKIKRLGEGPFSKIKLMRNIKTGKHYAMKKYNMFILKKKVRMTGKTNNKTKYSTQADEVYNEILIMKMLDHPNVVKLHQILQDDEEEKIYLIMDYCEHGDIVDWDHKKQVFISKWPLKTIAKFFKEAALGLQYLHSLNIVHRDIKPQNILITSEQTAKIIDFGRSVLLKSAEQKLSGSQGTYHFMAPQMLSQKIVGGYDGKLCDIWSLGVSIFCCVLGYLPFSDDNMMKLFEKIESSCYKQPKNLTPQQEKFMPLIKSMLPVDWTKRPCLKDICKQLQKIEKQL